MRNDRPPESVANSRKEIVTKNGEQKEKKEETGSLLWKEVLKARNKSTTLLTSFHKSGKVRAGINKMAEPWLRFLSPNTTHT
ncbi:hypothetical protein TNCV_4339921 [Trichonephila clavipes]|nr:hypothetical protein TNCV_4339921 [Trichonephila clavipes]